MIINFNRSVAGDLSTSGSCMQYVPQSGQYASCLGGFLGLVLNTYSTVSKNGQGENNSGLK